MRVLIIGGSDAGISAALRARELRRDVEITVLLSDSFPNYSLCALPFYLSGEVIDWRTLAHRTEFPGIEILGNRVAEAIELQGRSVTVRSPDGANAPLKYDRLIIATGARPLLPDIPGINHAFPLHTMGDSFNVHALVSSGKIRRAVIVGAGYIGVEMADALTHRGIEVELVGRSDSVLPTVDPELGELIRRELAAKGVRIRTGVQVAQITKRSGGLAIEAADGLAACGDLVIWAGGVRPASHLATAGIETGRTGAFKVNRRMETSAPEVYAAGDCVETWHRVLHTYTWLPLGTTAHKQGRVAGENAVGGEAEFQGVTGTQVVKIFDLAVARTGLLDKDARGAGHSPVTIQTETFDHKAYYPGANRLVVRITGDKRTGRLLGAQIAGHWKAEVAKRIDVFATALFHGMSVESLNALDLSYTPPLAAPWDAVQIAAQTWTGAHAGQFNKEN
jgi:NADPH-dependent 2,4-dienoyl-CoA reductase/sulfur reductase-like enzyme